MLDGSCKTALSGNFVFTKIPADTYRISVECGSYMFDNMDVVHLAGGKEVSLVITVPVSGGNAQAGAYYRGLLETHISLDAIVNGASLSVTRREGNDIIFPLVGQEYSVRVANRWSKTLLAVVTVDGLSVMDGEPGSFYSGGYILRPFSEMTIPGWRLNNSEVAKFAFTQKGKAYAQLKNQPTDLGVIACAIFEKKEPPPLPPSRRSDDLYSQDVLYSEEQSGSSILPEWIGTEFGRTEKHEVVETEFDRKDRPSIIKRIYYVGSKEQAESASFNPNPFPGCKPPPGWSG